MGSAARSPSSWPNAASSSTSPTSTRRRRPHGCGDRRRSAVGWPRRARRGGLPGARRRSCDARRLARRLGQQRRRAGHRSLLDAGRGDPADDARGQRAGNDERHRRCAGADDRRRPRPRDQRDLAGRDRRRTGRGQLLGEQARGDGLHPRHPLRPAPRRDRRQSSSRRSAPTASGRRCSRTSSTTPRPPAPSQATCSPRSRSRAEVGKLTERPRPILVLPRWRGPLLRLFDLSPRLALRLLPWVMRDARRKQRRYKKLIQAGKWPK